MPSLDDVEEAQFDFFYVKRKPHKNWATVNLCIIIIIICKYSKDGFWVKSVQSLHAKDYISNLQRIYKEDTKSWAERLKHD